MKIVVCVKEVPDMESKFKIVDNKIDESQIAFKMNDFDQYAVEAALQLKEKHGGEVIIVSSGPERSQKQVRQAFAMGADWGIQVSDTAVDAGDTFVIASALFNAIKSVGETLLGFMPPDIAETLNNTALMKNPDAPAGTTAPAPDAAKPQTGYQSGETQGLDNLIEGTGSTTQQPAFGQSTGQ